MRKLAKPENETYPMQTVVDTTASCDLYLTLPDEVDP